MTKANKASSLSLILFAGILFLAPRATGAISPCAPCGAMDVPNCGIQALLAYGSLIGREVPEFVAKTLDKNIAYKTVVPGVGNAANNKVAQCAQWRYFTGSDNCTFGETTYAYSTFRYTWACEVNSGGYESIICP